MKTTLNPGMQFEFAYTVGEDKTVPHIFPDIPEALVMPQVLATGFMVGLLEFACIKFINPHIDWPREQTVGIGIDVNHTAATPPGFTVTVKGRLDKVEGRKLTFSLAAYDDLDKIAKGSHQRFIIVADAFNAAVAEKSSARSTPDGGKEG